MSSKIAFLLIVALTLFACGDNSSPGPVAPVMAFDKIKAIDDGSVRHDEVPLTGAWPGRSILVLNAAPVVRLTEFPSISWPGALDVQVHKNVEKQFVDDAVADLSQPFPFLQNQTDLMRAQLKAFDAHSTAGDITLYFIPLALGNGQLQCYGCPKRVIAMAYIAEATPKNINTTIATLLPKSASEKLHKMIDSTVFKEQNEDYVFQDGNVTVRVGWRGDFVKDEKGEFHVVKQFFGVRSTVDLHTEEK